jgi:hypothetical protein
MSDHMSEGMIVCTECGELVPSIEVWPVGGERNWQPHTARPCTRPSAATPSRWS